MEMEIEIWGKESKKGCVGCGFLLLLLMSRFELHFLLRLD